MGAAGRASLGAGNTTLIFTPTEPVPADAADAQYLATQVIDFRDGQALTVVDTAYFDPRTQRIVSDPSQLPGLTIGGTFGIQRTVQCIGFVTGWVSTGDHAGGPASYLGTGCGSPKLIASRSITASDKSWHLLVSGWPRAGIVGGGKSGDRGDARAAGRRGAR